MTTIKGLPTTGAKAYYLLEHLYTQKIPAVCITDSDESAENITDDLTALALLFPGIRTPVTEVLTGNTNRKLATLYNLINRPFDILVTSAETASLQTIAKKDFRILRLSVDGVYKHDEIITYLTTNGYIRTDYVDTEGGYSVRGEIIDIWPPNSSSPLRLVFDDNRLESIRTFDAETQRSIEFITKYEIIPSSESSDKGTLKDYIPDPLTTVVMCEDAGPAPAWAQGMPAVSIDRLSGISMGYTENNRYMGNFGLFQTDKERWQQEGLASVIFCDNEGQKDRLLEILEEHHISSIPPIHIARLTTGFIHTGKKLCVLCYNEIFTATGRTVRFPKFKKGRTIEGLWEISSGDYVVHEKYGIGRYRGLNKIAIADNASEYLTIEYKGGDKLFVPITDFQKVQKYIGVEGKRPRLYSMDTVGWEHAKERAKKSANEMAKKLYEIYTSRKSIKGIPFAGDSEFEKTLAASFVYNETKDQLKAIQDVKDDMQKPSPMDRLVLGDVGFGKTEVAVRAAFKCVLSSKQAAVLAPTTVLAEQHYQTFTERLNTFPLKLALLSRFQSKAEQKKIVADINSGTVDIAIGTHRLLQKDIAFKNLGLVIIDDEHRFGVSQKEKIKLIRAASGSKTALDTLSLTATPIPRTLSMALSGIKDISVIETPPEGRFDVETHITAYDEQVVQQALRAEIARGGQVFYLHNYIHSIYSRMNYLQSLLPDVRFSVIHGRMKAAEIEKTMWEFMHKKTDCLLATTIIEAGIDIPNVNTIIIEKSEKFGLAQLYQLRGRVGRGRKKAYCYLFYSDDTLSSDAGKRLQATYEFAKLGSGFKLALRDMEIRGAGEILGLKQHGFIQDVGLNMYSKFISESINEMKGEDATPKETQPQIHLNIPSYIPEDYITQDEIRITFYRRFMSSPDEQSIAQVTEELTDRFGTPPPPLRNLTRVMELRLLMYKLQILDIRETGNHIHIDFASREYLLKLSGAYTSDIPLTLSDTATVSVAMREIEDSGTDTLSFIKIFFINLVKISNNLVQ